MELAALLTLLQSVLGISNAIAGAVATLHSGGELSDEQKAAIKNAQALADAAATEAEDDVLNRS